MRLVLRYNDCGKSMGSGNKTSGIRGLGVVPEFRGCENTSTHSVAGCNMVALGHGSWGVSVWALGQTLRPLGKYIH